MHLEQKAYLDRHGWRDYGLWFLGVDTEMDEETKGHYEFRTATSGACTVAE